MIPIAGANCIYFEPSNLGGVCRHSDMRRGFWIFSYKGNCILTHEEKVFKAECELRVPKFIVAEETKIPTPVKKRSGTHIHKPKHIHKHKEK